MLKLTNTHLANAKRVLCAAAAQREAKSATSGEKKNDYGRDIERT